MGALVLERAHRVADTLKRALGPRIMQKLGKKKGLSIEFWMQVSSCKPIATTTTLKRVHVNELVKPRGLRRHATRNLVDDKCVASLTCKRKRKVSNILVEILSSLILVGQIQLNLVWKRKTEKKKKKFVYKSKHKIFLSLFINSCSHLTWRNCIASDWYAMLILMLVQMQLACLVWLASDLWLELESSSKDNCSCWYTFLCVHVEKSGYLHYLWWEPESLFVRDFDNNNNNNRI